MTPAQVVAMVAGVCGVSVEDMQNECRDRELVYARTIAVMMLLEDKVRNSEIRMLFPLFSRITILYINRYRFNELIQEDKQFKALYLECIKQYAIATNDL